MSLFDVIRYPVTDIQSEEVGEIPREILIPWMRECYELAGQPVPANLDNAVYNSVLMAVLLIDIRRSAHGDSVTVDYFKDFFKYRLIKRIEEYNSTDVNLPDFPSQISKSDSET